MRKFLVACFVLLSVCGVMSQAPPGKHCCMPGKQVEMSYGSNVATNGSYYRQLVRGAYDFAGRRYGSISHVTYINGTRISARIIMLADEGVQYYISDGTCIKLGDALVEPKRCIDDEYHEIDFIFLGDGELAARVWEMPINDSKHGMYGNTVLSVTADSCVPIGQSSLLYLGSSPHLVPVSESGGYNNYTKGIADPDFWFTPPPYCPPASAPARRSTDVPQEHLLLLRLAMIGGWEQ